MLRLVAPRLSVSSTRTFLRATPAIHRTMSSSSKPAHLNKMFIMKKVDEKTRKDNIFRRVRWTGESSQFVSMTIPVGGDIGKETHTVDQTLIFTDGKAKAIVNGEESEVGEGDIVIVPAGCEHNFVNIGDIPLQVSTVYAPAEHNENTVHKTKEEGDELEDAGKDEPPAWSQQKHSK